MTTVKGMIEARVNFAKNKLGLISKMAKRDVAKKGIESPVKSASIVRSRHDFLDARNSAILEIDAAMMEKNRKVTKRLLKQSVARVSKENQAAAELAM